MNTQNWALVTASIVLTQAANGSLVGHWKFDEGSGTTTADASGFGNDGVLVHSKSSTWTNGVTGRALYFDGTIGVGSTYVTIPDAPSLHLTNACSFAAWVRCDDITRDAPILDKEGDGKLSYWFGAFGASGAVPGNFGVLLSANGNQPWTIYDRNQGLMSQGLWMHVASTWDGVTIRHYLNGVLLPQTAAFAGPIHVSDATLVIGANFPYSTTSFKGIIDEARLYNHALTLEEVRTLAGITPRLVGHWSFDEGSGTNILDSSGLGNHGTLTNPQPITWTVGRIGSALYFDGTVGFDSSYVRVSDAPSLRITAGLTCSAWVRCDDISRDAPVLAKEGEGKLSYWFGTYGLPSDGGGITAPGNFGVLLSADGNQPWTIHDRNQGAVPQDQWVHLASSWDGATVRHYLNGEFVAGGATFTEPIHVSDAFLAIGVNSLYNFAANHTAFKGAIDEVRLYNYALSGEEIQALYLGSAFRITSLVRQGADVRLAWECVAGRTYVVQTNAVSAGSGLSGGFGDLSAPIVVPAGFFSGTTNYVHAGGATNSFAGYYRVKLLP